jgi:enoyl-CoA hydratase/3-hydroxyacyl-CoA dehydrogenase
MAFPMGIFELADYTGLDVVFKASKEMISRDKKVINPHPLIERLYSEKKLGQKSGSGFYNYGSDNKYERVNLSEKEAGKYDPIAIVSVAANNAAWLLTNGVSDVGDLDKALRLGMGLKKPLFTIVEEFGLKKVLVTLENMSNKYGKFYEPDAYLRKIAS